MFVTNVLLKINILKSLPVDFFIKIWNVIDEKSIYIEASLLSTCIKAERSREI